MSCPLRSEPEQNSPNPRNSRSAAGGVGGQISLGGTARRQRIHSMSAMLSGTVPRPSSAGTKSVVGARTVAGAALAAAHLLFMAVTGLIAAKFAEAGRQKIRV